jgi:heme A synthase
MMTKTYRILADAIATAVALQAALIAFATFGLMNDLDGGKVLDRSYDGNAGWMLHAVIGDVVIPLMALILMIVAVRAKVPGGVRWAAVVLGVVIVQVALAGVAHAASVVGLLHGLNALILFTVALLAARRGRAQSGAGEPAPSVVAGR